MVGKAFQKIRGGLSKGTDAVAFLAVREPELSGFEINLGPSQRQDLTFPAARQGQQLYSVNRQRVFTFTLGCFQCSAQRPILVHRQEPIAAPVGGTFDAVHRIVLPETFAHRVPEDAAKQASGTGCSTGPARHPNDTSALRFAHFGGLARLNRMQKAANVERLYLGDCQSAQKGQDVT